MNALRYISPKVLLMIGSFVTLWVGLLVAFIFPDAIMQAQAHYDISDTFSLLAIGAMAFFIATR